MIVHTGKNGVFNAQITNFSSKKFQVHFKWNIRRRKCNHFFFQLCWVQSISSLWGFNKCQNASERETVVVKPQNWECDPKCVLDLAPSLRFNCIWGAVAHHMFYRNVPGLLKAKLMQLEYFINSDFPKTCIILRCGLFPQVKFVLGFCRLYWNAFLLQETCTVI